MPPAELESALIQQILAAFAPNIHPNADLLTHSFGEEAAALIREFSELDNWQALSADFLNQAPEGWGTALSFFSAEALRFYLPA